jgi:hypothetical protein
MDKYIYDLTKTLIPYIVGFGSAYLLQYLVERRRLKRINGAINSHLKDIIYEDLPELINNYKLCKELTNNDKNHVVKVFEGFNGDIYKGINPSDLYKIYYGKGENKFKQLIEIYSVISFLKENLPYDMHANYIDAINEHLDNRVKGNESRIVHMKTCVGCKSIKTHTLDSYDLRVGEVERLQTSIKNFLN